MAFIRLPFSIKITVEFLWNDKVVVNVHHIFKADSSAPTTADIINVCQVIDTVYDVNWLPVMSNECALINVSGISLDSENGAFGESGLSYPRAGDVLGQSVSNNVALVATLRTPFAGRSYRGRTFLPGIPEAETSQNGVTATVQAAALDTLLGIDDSLITIGFRHRVASFFTEGAPRAVGISTNVTGVAVNTRVDTQRRRLPDAVS